MPGEPTPVEDFVFHTQFINSRWWSHRVQAEPVAAATIRARPPRGLMRTRRDGWSAAGPDGQVEGGGGAARPARKRLKRRLPPWKLLL